MELRRAGVSEARLLLLNVIRPVYFYEWPDDGQEGGLTVNWQLELPGGQAKKKEGGARAAIRELVEEAGIGAENVLCWTEGYLSPSANDAGTHVERYGMWYVLLTGTPHPPHDPKNPGKYKEGIVGWNEVPLSELGRFLDSAAKNGTPIELFVHLAANGLLAGLLGGWSALKK